MKLRSALNARVLTQLLDSARRTNWVLIHRNSDKVHAEEASLWVLAWLLLLLLLLLLLHRCKLFH